MNYGSTSYPSPVPVSLEAREFRAQDTQPEDLKEPWFPKGRKGFYPRAEEHHIMVSRMNDEAGAFGQFRAPKPKPLTVQGSGSRL